MDRVGISAGRAAGRVHRIRNGETIGCVAQQTERHRTHHRASREHRTSADVVLAEFLLLHAWMIGGKRDVNRDGHARIERLCRHARAAAGMTDLLLRRGRRDHARDPRLCGVTAQPLKHDKCADPVVDRPRHNPPIGQLDQLTVNHTRVADAEPFQRLGLVCRTDIDPEVGDLRRLFALIRFHEMNRFLADHPQHVTIATEKADSLCHQHLRVPSTNGFEIHESVFVDPGDDDSDFVDVTREQDRGAALTFHGGKTVTDHVGADLSERSGFRTPNSCRRRFEAGRARCVE